MNNGPGATKQEKPLGYDAIKKCGDVMATFCGHDHDHDHDYVTMWEGKREFDTWIVLKGGEVINKVSFPKTFQKTDWRDRPIDPECE